MDLDTVWDMFMKNLLNTSKFTEVSITKRAGIPFLYLTSDSIMNRKEVEKIIERAAVASMKGKRLHFESIYVRSENQMIVYRCRFYVPQQKMFCCGNLCHDCIRFR
ncbi:hypothetical protein [Bacillus sp. Marseille-Q3570]|uniref:hypothetical protein n=1 Tax=Bacillus sp. Marseille-Q3570 TaxID=2963522 RepID=UPI0021B72C18|nr:hypothetical protein [Bacillus sp. Marseille-Q3570]